MKNVLTEKSYVPQGIIQIYDIESKEKIYETHNMIVGSGRSLISNAIFCNKPIDPSKFIMFFDNYSGPTIFSMTMDFLKTNNIIKYPIDNSGNEVTRLGHYREIASENGDVEYDFNTYYTYGNQTSDIQNISAVNNEYPVKIDGIIKYDTADTNNNIIITGIGIEYKESEDSSILFSRAYIDPVYMRPGRKYLVHYTLYF